MSNIIETLEEFNQYLHYDQPQLKLIFAPLLSVDILEYWTVQSKLNKIEQIHEYLLDFDIDVFPNHGYMEVYRKAIIPCALIDNV